MRKARNALFIFLLFCAYPPAAIRAFDLPDEALMLLAQASVDPCSICAKEKSKKAYAMIDKIYAPGSVIVTDAPCRLVKPSGTEELDLTLTCYPSEAFIEKLSGEEAPPKLVFSFSTQDKHLVGINPKDYTSPEIVKTYKEAKPGTTFEGRLEVVAYPYGQGGGFNYFGERGRLQIHCRVLDLKPAGS